MRFTPYVVGSDARQEAGSCSSKALDLQPRNVHFDFNWAMGGL
jgi:hypothetical protein